MYTIYINLKKKDILGLHAEKFFTDRSYLLVGALDQKSL